ncbi:MAG: serine/threonine-protein kinase [Mariprofundaceae bacterium]|nr:serine/threonine-protein kinase [Mariprofundaceae bacterium]
MFALSYTMQGPLHYVEQKLYDLGLFLHSTSGSSNVVIIAIDDESIALQSWPWPRKNMADLLEKITPYKPTSIGINLKYRSKEAAQNTTLLQNMIHDIQKQVPTAENQTLLKQYQHHLQQQDDQRTINTAYHFGHTVFPIRLEMNDTEEHIRLPKSLTKLRLNRINPEDVSTNIASKAIPPFEHLAQNVGLGYVYFDKEQNVIRSEYLATQINEQLIPSFSLALAATSLNVAIQDIEYEDDYLIVGQLKIPVNSELKMLPTFYRSDQGKRFEKYSFKDVLSGEVNAATFRDKYVLIGLTSRETEAYIKTPIGHLSETEFQAHLLDSILQQKSIINPQWVQWLGYALFLFITIYALTIIVNQAGKRRVIFMTTGISILLIGSSIYLMSEMEAWLPTATMVCMLMSIQLFYAFKKRTSSKEVAQTISKESAATNRMLGLSFQNQGMLDMAFDKFRKCPVDDEVKPLLYNLALDFERKRQFNKAQSVYEYISETDPSYKDVTNKIDMVKNAGETIIFGTSGNTTGRMNSLLLSSNSKPTLGRYELVKELGKGAMGIVYLGLDPKINRKVAIKTMALSQEFEGSELEDIKQRFFREAETAGGLNHPNIVTMYDAGEQNDLAFIAMEFLDGIDLSPYTKKGKLMPAAATLKIVGKVAESLHYAHQKGVVHRDIKPANIMFLKNKTVKVTDFGIARITAVTKTKTGVVLGTPSYMSPEQLAGKHVDGRSDLFSLGIMLYELLSGTRPFKGDSMATLMFQIANEPHPDIREYCPNLPESVSKLIDKILAKDRESRHSNGAEVVQHIIKCLRDLARQGNKK